MSRVGAAPELPITEGGWRREGEAALALVQAAETGKEEGDTGGWS